MKKSIIFIGGILLLVCAMFVVVSPNKLSMAVVGLMTVFVALGFVFGITPNLQYISAFKQGVRNLDDVRKINSTNLWLPLSQIKPFFGQKALDNMFSDYIEKAMEQREQGVVISDVENAINEDSLSVRSWRGVVLQISGTLTALGLLGTFLGLVTGISGVGFGTLEETVSGIETMLTGITTAFYTSIVGVILSIAFNAVYRVVWNMMLREHQLFIERFHIVIQPEAEEMVRAKQYLNTEQMIGYLARIQDMGTKLMNMTGTAESQEQRVMIELLAGVQRGELTFSLEPICDLSDRSVVKAEANLRWNHEQLGMINPATYMSIVSANGYIVKLDTTMWQNVCAMLKAWYDAGLHPAPVVVNISKTDILAMDIAEYFTDLVERYGLTPRDIELSLAAEAYTVCYDEVSKLESALLQKGFKVSVYGFDGDFMKLRDTRADEIKLDLSSLAEDVDLVYIFDQAVSRHYKLTADGILSAKVLADVKKSGCDFGQGSHLYKALTRKEYEALMQY